MENSKKWIIGLLVVLVIGIIVYYVMTMPATPPLDPTQKSIENYINS